MESDDSGDDMGAGVPWPRTPSSAGRSPSPSCQPVAPFMVAVPMAFPAPMMLGCGGLPMALAGGASSSTASGLPAAAAAAPAPTNDAAWVNEVRAMAARLQVLATAVPKPLESRCRHSEVATALTSDTLEHLQAAAIRFEALRAEAAAFELEADAADADAATAESEWLEAQAEIDELTAAALAEREARLEEHRIAAAALAASARLATEARDSVAAAQESTRRRAEVASQRVAELRKALEREARDADEAQQKAARARAARDSAKELPALRARRKAADARASRFKEECANLQRQVESLQAEDETSKQTGNGARAEVLEARIAEIERECRYLQQGGDEASEGASAHETEELISAQECNKRLLAEAREARVERDEASSALLKMEKEVESVQSRCNILCLENTDINSQVSDHRSQHDRMVAEVERRRGEIETLEQTARNMEDETKVSQIQHREAWSTSRNLTLARQRAEKKSTLLEWNLQNALARLEKEKPGAALGRCLMQSRPRDLVTSSKHKMRPRRDRMAGSDAGSESVDADAVSTTAGESAADTLVEIGHA